jgi:type I restriction enzyme, S subunit
VVYTSNREEPKIEELFSHIDAGVVALQKAKQLLKQYRQSVLKAAVTGELTREWREQNKDDAHGSANVAGGRMPGATKLEPASELLNRILIERRAKWEEQQLEQFKAQGKVPKDDKWKLKYKADLLPSSDQLFDLPDSWCWATLQNVFDVITDGDHQPPPKANEGVPFLVIGNVNRGKLNFDNTRFVSQEYYQGLGEIRVPKKGDLLYTVVGSFGIPVKVDTEKAFCVQRHIAILKPSNFVDREFLYYILNSGYIYKQTSDVATGTAQKTVGLGELRKIVSPLPPLNEQIEIANRVSTKIEAINRLEEQIKVKLLKAEKTKQSILATAFSGQLFKENNREAA